MYVDMYVTCVLSTGRIQKASGPLELEIQGVVSCLALGLGTELWSPEVAASVCKH